jgi:hypothetical protein
LISILSAGLSVTPDYQYDCGRQMCKWMHPLKESETPGITKLFSHCRWFLIATGRQQRSDNCILTTPSMESHELEILMVSNPPVRLEGFLSLRDFRGFVLEIETTIFHIITVF